VVDAERPSVLPALEQRLGCDGILVQVAAGQQLSASRFTVLTFLTTEAEPSCQQSTAWLIFWVRTARRSDLSSFRPAQSSRTVL